MGKEIHRGSYKRLKLDPITKWYMQKYGSVLKNETHKILYDFGIQKNHQIAARRPDLEIIKKEKEQRIFRLMDFAIPADHRVKIKAKRLTNTWTLPENWKSFGRKGQSNINCCWLSKRDEFITKESRPSYVINSSLLGYFVFQLYIYIYIYYIYIYIYIYRERERERERKQRVNIFGNCQFLTKAIIRSSVLGMRLKCIWWSGSAPEALENVEYSFISITLKSTLTRNGITSSKGQIELFNHLLRTFIIIVYLKPYNCMHINHIT